MKYKEMFVPGLIQPVVEVKSREEAFLTAVQQLEKMGYVNENYLNGLIAREREFPAGLITKYSSIVSPHLECEYVEKPFVPIMQLKDPICSYQTGDSQETTVENLFFLGIEEPEEQVGLLRTFMNLSMDETFVENYKKQETPQNIYELITDYIQGEEKMKNRLIVARGSEVTTSQAITSKIQSMLEDDGIAFPVETADHKPIQSEFLTVGIYVYVAQPDGEVLEQAKDLGIEAFPRIPFLTGMGVEPIYDSIKELVQ